MTTPARRLAASDSVVDAVLGDEAVLLNVQSGVYFGLDAVGARIWELLVDGTTHDEIVDRLLGEYDVDAVQLRADVERFVQVLESKGLAREVKG